MTPDQIALAKEKARIQLDKERAIIKTALEAAVSDPNVAIVLRHIARISGFFQNARVINPQTGDVNANGTIYNVGRESVYLDLRRMMTDEVRTIVERKGE